MTLNKVGNGREEHQRDEDGDSKLCAGGNGEKQFGLDQSLHQIAPND